MFLLHFTCLCSNFSDGPIPTRKKAKAKMKVMMIEDLSSEAEPEVTTKTKAKVKAMIDGLSSESEYDAPVRLPAALYVPATLLPLQS
jgi:hypothetical protein